MSARNTDSPLFSQPQEDDESPFPPQPSKFGKHVEDYREGGRRVLASRKKHFLIMAIVVLDVAALLANVFIQLIACEMDQRDEPWVEQVSEALEITGLVCSCLFIVELGACLFSFGFRCVTLAHISSSRNTATDKIM
jgi:hypothetical protein